MLTATALVLERHKIRIPEKVAAALPTLASREKKARALAVPGHYGGVQILFGEPPLAKAREHIEKRLAKGRAKEEQASEEWTLLARYLSNLWEITFSLDRDRYTMVLPMVARDIGLIPKTEGEEVLIFVCGAIFEIWNPDE